MTLIGFSAVVIDTTSNKSHEKPLSQSEKSHANGQSSGVWDKLKKPVVLRFTTK
jgi:hypothetical protein